MRQHTRGLSQGTAGTAEQEVSAWRDHWTTWAHDGQGASTVGGMVASVPNIAGMGAWWPVYEHAYTLFDCCKPHQAAGLASLSEVSCNHVGRRRPLPKGHEAGSDCGS